MEHDITIVGTVHAPNIKSYSNVFQLDDITPILRSLVGHMHIVGISKEKMLYIVSVLTPGSKDVVIELPLVQRLFAAHCNVVANMSMAHSTEFREYLPLENTEVMREFKEHGTLMRFHLLLYRAVRRRGELTLRRNEYDPDFD